MHVNAFPNIPFLESQVSCLDCLDLFVVYWFQQCLNLSSKILIESTRVESQCMSWQTHRDLWASMWVKRATESTLEALCEHCVSPSDATVLRCSRRRQQTKLERSELKCTDWGPTCTAGKIECRMSCLILRICCLIQPYFVVGVWDLWSGITAGHKSSFWSHR